MAKELADVIVTAMVARASVSGDGATVVEQQLQARVEEEITAAGDIRLLQVLAISGDMGATATAVYGAPGTGPSGEAVEITHTWEDAKACLGLLILTAAAAVDDLTGDAWDTVDERLRFLVAKVRHRPDTKPQLTRSTPCTEGRTAVRALPRHPLPCGRTRPSGAYPGSPVGEEWKTSGR
ncbi:hypothetical protein [Streptomyces sp. TN58]|uniref:hypothetical protein n=1 Tax=Streptomyces sp. TN58 TaxID=234612 RepID=UPI0009503B29|nr:hypothetical protein [Streptomyces sp. TN58]APU39258.1 hypothetical protein BSL84_05205 [Streptomyces sp. TN58]